jgi:DNA-binding transcriptional MerR regulator
MTTWKIGELARRTGLTVRTLHHYDQIGLLSPSARSRSGHRLYQERDVARLQQIVSLRQLGLPLEEIRECLGRRRFSALRVVELHLTRLRAQLAQQRSLCERLESIAARLRTKEDVSVEHLLATIEAIQMHEKYFTPEELERIKRRGEVVGAERIKEVEQEWPRLIAEVRAEMEKGTDPKSPVVQKLAERWMSLVNEFTGGDAQIASKLGQMYQQESSVRESAGIDAEMFSYVQRATQR